MSSHIDPRDAATLPYYNSKELGSSQKNADKSVANEANPGRHMNHKPLEFITVSLANEQDGKGISKVIRTQVMKDYFWKQRNLEKSERIPTDQPTSPSQYKGRFRLNTQPKKSKPRPVSRKAKGHNSTSNDAFGAQKGRIVMPRGPITDLSIYDPDGFFASTPMGLLGGYLDPFNSFSLKLKPESLKLIYYYKQSYSKDFLDLNVGGGYCLFDAREHSALFHSILYLVALDFNLRRGFTDDLGCLYHSTEAFRLINEKIRNGSIEDATIAAVALIAAKESLNGMFDVSYMHMQGLKDMVHKRGGIEKIYGIHRGVVMWADFCNSTVWNCSPQFPYVPLSTNLGDTSFPPNPLEVTENVSLQRLFSVEQQLISIVQSLRNISTAKEANAHKHGASRVYDVEYRLHLLQAQVSQDDIAPSDIYPLCAALNIFLYLAIRELPVRAQLMRLLIDRLQTWYKVASQEQSNSSVQRNQSWVLWMLFIGYAAALENGRQEWFAQALKSAYVETQYRDVDELHDVLKNLLWQDAWCEHYFKKLRIELA